MRFICSHFAVLSTVSDIDLITRIFVAPITPMSDRALQNDLTVKPLAPTSTGKHESFPPLLWHCPVIRHISIFFLSWASSICSSHGTVSSHITMSFSLFEKNIKSRRKDVFTMCSRKINLVITSTFNSQSIEGDRMFGLGFIVFLGFMPALTNCISLFPGLNLFVRYCWHSFTRQFKTLFYHCNTLL